MSAPPLMPPPVESQIASVPVDHACIACGYNLRGQAAEWDRQTHRWRAGCPECGTIQAVAVTAEAPSVVSNGQRWAAVIAVAIAAFVLWHLLGWIARGVAQSIDVGAGIAAQWLSARMGGRPPLTGPAPPPVIEWPQFATVVGAHGVRIALASAGVGVMVALTPYAREAQRTLLLLGLLAMAGLIGLWMFLGGYSPESTDPVGQMLQFLAVVNNGRGLSTLAPVIDWQWQVGGGGVAIIIAIVAGRIGQAIGRPLAGWLAVMCLPPEMRPAFLRRPPAG